MPYSSVEKTLTILSSFLPNNRERGTVEISNETGIHVSTVSRLLHILAGHGYLQLDSRTKKYSLGKTALDMGRTIHQNLRDQLVIIAQPFIDDLRDRLERDVALSVLINDSIIIAYRAWAPNPNKILYTIGDRLPFYASAGGRAILAFSTPGHIESLLQTKLTPLTKKTITDPDDIKRCLEECRKNGIAIDLGEIYEDFYFAAAPVFDYEKKPIGAVNVGEPANLAKNGFKPEIIEGIKDTAAKISYQLHYRE